GKPLVAKSSFSNRFQILVEVTQLLAHAATQMTVDVDRQVERIDIFRQHIVWQWLRSLWTFEQLREHKISCAFGNWTAYLWIVVPRNFFRRRHTRRLPFLSRL